MYAYAEICLAAAPLQPAAKPPTVSQPGSRTPSLVMSQSLVLFHTIECRFLINGPIISNLQNLLPSLQFQKEITFLPSARSWICAISEKVVQHTAKKQATIISDKAIICALLLEQPNDCWFLELELSAGSDMLDTNYHWSWCVRGGCWVDR